jgi:hypothetical protein
VLIAIYTFLEPALSFGDVAFSFGSRETIKTGRRHVRLETSGRGSLRAVQEATDAVVDEIEEMVKAKVSELT